MKETVGSLRAYFILVGVASAAANILTLASGLNLLGYALTGAGLVLSAGFLYAGIKMRDLLSTRPDRIKQLLFANVGLVLINVALNLSVGYTRGLAQAGIALAISAYLLSSVTRLAAQAAVPSATSPDAAPAAAPAAWLPDPTGRHELRYWDSRAWTQHVSDAGVADVDALAETS